MAANQRRILEQSNPLQTVELTFLEHLQELRTRVTWVAVTVLVAGLVAFALHDQLVRVLLLPLGHKDLVYLTPLSGVNFLIKLSLYVGVLAALPVIVHQLYRFLEPAAPSRIRRAPLYIVASVVLAFMGIMFAYFVGLPAALKFLTNIGIANVNPMITVDSYLSFVSGYAFASAFLFQIPLIMTLINTLRPTPPSQLLKYERHVVVITLIAAAIISPTPDVAGQLLMGAPIFIMWHIGLFIMWRQQVRRAKKAATEIAQTAAENQSHPEYTPKIRQTIIPEAPKPKPTGAQLQFADVIVQRKTQIIPPAPIPAVPPQQKQKLVAPKIDMVAPSSSMAAQSKERFIQIPQRVVEARRTVAKARSIDGITRAPRLVRDISSTS